VLMSPSATFEEITPKVAEKMLAGNKGNRNLRRMRVNQLVRDITLGQWKVTGDAIKFDTTRRLVDGQHRLVAIVEAGKTCTSLVIRNLDPGAIIALDTGASRTPGDSLVVAGMCSAKISTPLASAIKHYAQFHAGPKALINPGFKVPPWAVISMGKRHAAALIPWCEKLAVPAFSRVRMGAVGAYAALALITSEVDKDMAEAFWLGVTTGANLDCKAPEYMLRESFGGIRGGSTRHVRGTYIAWMIKAWNARRDDHKICRFRWSPGEKFPSISGWSYPGTQLVEIHAKQEAQAHAQRETLAVVLAAKAAKCKAAAPKPSCLQVA